MSTSHWESHRLGKKPIIDLLHLEELSEYYNEIMEIENEIDIEFSYSNSSGKEFSKNLISRENFYDLKLNYLPLGKYIYKMNLKNSTEKIVNTGVFSIV